MSGSLVGRVLRPVTLLAAGMLIAQTTVSIAATSVSPTATQTRSVSCQAMNFHPIEPGTGLRITGGTFLYRLDDGPNTDANAGFFVCDPHLPDRAVVTRVQFTVRDDSAHVRIAYCGLDRSSLKPGSAGPFQTLAQVSPTSTAGRPGTVRKSDSSIAHATVDTTDWAYWLQCRIEFEDGQIANAASGLYGASIDYRISSTNG